MRWYAGAWRTEAGIARHKDPVKGRERQRRVREKDRLTYNLKVYIRRNNRLNRKDEEVLRGNPQAEA